MKTQQCMLQTRSAETFLLALIGLVLEDARKKVELYRKHKDYRNWLTEALKDESIETKQDPQASLNELQNPEEVERTKWTPKLLDDWLAFGSPNIGFCGDEDTKPVSVRSSLILRHFPEMAPYHSLLTHRQKGAPSHRQKGAPPHPTRMAGLLRCTNPASCHPLLFSPFPVFRWNVVLSLFRIPPPSSFCFFSFSLTVGSSWLSWLSLIYGCKDPCSLGLLNMTSGSWMSNFCNLLSPNDCILADKGYRGIDWVQTELPYANPR